MKIYPQEVKDGLSELISTANKITVDSTIAPSSLTKEEMEIAIATNLEHQEDLFPLDCILVSTGWNKNDDVFDKAETYKAKNTPANKQLNFMHDDGKIIGHMVSCKILDRSGAALNDGPIEEMPDFDVAISAYIYKALRDEEKSEIVKMVLANIDKWFVSMECFFDDYDYALIDTDGSQKVVNRKESTAFLSKHLRAYGGDGKYQQYKVGRILKNIIFSGIGIVDNPANPRSIIFSNLQSFSSTIIDDTIEREKAMELEQALAALQTANDKAAALATTNEELTKLSAETASVLAQTKAELELKIAELETVKAQLQEIELAKKNAERKTALVAHVDEARADELIAKFSGCSDEIFAELVKVASLGAKKMTEKCSDDKDMDDTEKDKEDEAKAEEAEEKLADTKTEDAAASLAPESDNKVDETKIALANFINSRIENFKSSKKGLK